MSETRQANRPDTLQASIAFHAERHPDRPALVCEGRSLTYGELHRESNRTANALVDAGLEPGDRVAFLGKESEHYYDILMACAKAGTVLVPINWRLTADEISHIVHDSQTALLFVEEEFTAAATSVGVPKRVVLDRDGDCGAGLYAWKEGQPEAVPERASGADTPIAQIYTSGTTGLPKGVVLAQRSFFAVRDALDSAALDWIDWRESDVSLIGIPGFHIGGLWWATQGLNAGVTNVALRMFVSREAVDTIRDHGVTTTCLVPAMLQMMLAEPGLRPGDFNTLRKVVYGGSPISETLLSKCLDEVGCEFAQIYGLTETGNTAVCLPPGDHVPGSPRMKAAGRPYPGFELKIVDEYGAPVSERAIGEICIRTPARMVEYWRLPEATAETLVDGWVHTGDAGYMDEDGYVYVYDRIKDTIIVAGENVYPAEVEDALAKHPAVADSAVVGVPDERWGESVHAFVVFRRGEKASPRELTVFLRERIAGFKIPGSFTEIDELPRNPSGKILRRSLRDRFWEGRDRYVN